ncbi:hypothetical protein [Pseudomonas fluorescens]|uniref:hypothetical protein n=1 Tax=Pseudomonas fluorescens TaxID=294 RepID=UPI0006428559|nr:hypothetical protein [Pseudomonas fluorescens]
MSKAFQNPAAVAQAAVALLYELKKSGVDVSAVADAAKSGIIRGDIYKWVSADLVTDSQNAVDDILRTVDESSPA